MDKLQGVVSDITFRNEDSGFVVMKLAPASGDEPVVCVGLMPTLDRGESVAVQGDYRNHPKFGRQFNVEAYEIVRPGTREGILSLLGSGLISHIGRTRAQAIVERFGLDTLDVLDREPRRLLEVPGIGPRILEKIEQAWKRKRSLRDLALFLQDLGASTNLIAKIYTAYGDKAREIISREPYRLIDDIWGVGFKKADALAQRLGFRGHSYRRIRAGILHTLMEALGEGNLYLPRRELVESAARLLEVAPEQVEYSLDHLATTEALREERECIYLKSSFAAENDTAGGIRSLVHNAAGLSGEFSGEYVDTWLEGWSGRHSWRGDPRQEEAVRGAIVNPVFLLTGGPGTGKTTILQVIVSFFREHRLPVQLAAPTGRAAQRMGSVAGLKAQTIHRLLEFRPGRKGVGFERNARRKLEARVVVIDEVSMIDIFLMRALLEALGEGTRLVLVGDHHQLPSVGPGNVLSDLIAAGVLPHVNLTTVFRQAARSTIVRAAHRMIRGEVPPLHNDAADDCFFIREEDPEACVTTIVELVTRRLPDRYRFDPIADIQVLSPLHRGVLGTRNLNRVLQTELVPRHNVVQRGERSFSPGDKVMQIRNNYELAVFNGDIGHVADVGGETGLCVDYQGRRVQYSQAELDELVHAYCISIHKSQGSEFKAVIIPVSTLHYIMLQRNLLYTALTRARDLCVFVGTPKALYLAVNNDRAINRYSRLAERIRGRCAGDDRGETEGASAHEHGGSGETSGRDAGAVRD